MVCLDLTSIMRSIVVVFSAIALSFFIIALFDWVRKLAGLISGRALKKKKALFMEAFYAACKEQGVVRSGTPAALLATFMKGECKDIKIEAIYGSLRYDDRVMVVLYDPKIGWAYTNAIATFYRDGRVSVRRNAEEILMVAPTKLGQEMYEKYMAAIER